MANISVGMSNPPPRRAGFGCSADGVCVLLRFSCQFPHFITCCHNLHMNQQTCFHKVPHEQNTMNHKPTMKANTYYFYMSPLISSLSFLVFNNLLEKYDGPQYSIFCGVLRASEDAFKDYDTVSRPRKENSGHGIVRFVMC